MLKVTVFTPTYNRGYIIKRLYESLCRQSVKSFEWIVINDGSMDNTDQLFKVWMECNNDFEIRYYTCSNQGKHSAINRAVELAEGELFFIVDSDDYLCEHAIETILSKESTLPQNNFAGIAFNRGYDRDNIIGKTFSGDYVDATALERRKFKIIGDKAEVFYTDILKKYKFPVFEREKFLTEGVVWYEIANDGYQLRWYNEIIYICNYLEDGLTYNSTLAENNFNGYTYSTKKILKFNLSFIEKFIMIGNYMDTSLKVGITSKQASANINVPIFLLYLSFIALLIKRKLKLWIKRS